MKVFFVEITTRKKIKNEISLEDIRKVPTHYLQCYEYEKKVIQIDYEPAADEFNDLYFRKVILKSLKKQYPSIVDCNIMDESPLLKAK